MQKFKVNLDIFKPTGKYYTSGEYLSEKKYWFEVFEEVREFAALGKIPGLREGACYTKEPGEMDWIIHIDSEEFPQAYPHLIILKNPF